MVDGVIIEIDRDNWNAIQQEGNHKNKRAMITLVSFMTRDERVKLQHCFTAKEMW